MVDLLWQSTDKRSLETVMFRHIEMAVCCAKPPYALRSMLYARRTKPRLTRAAPNHCLRICVLTTLRKSSAAGLSQPTIAQSDADRLKNSANCFHGRTYYPIAGYKVQAE
jgi:hypothetical protein